MPISKEEALAYVKDESLSRFWAPPDPPKVRYKRDVLFIACVKWDGGLRGDKAGHGNCAACGRYNMECDMCPLGGADKYSDPDSDTCCDGLYVKFEDAETDRQAKIRAKKVFEFIKAKYKEVSGKDYE